MGQLNPMGKICLECCVLEGCCFLQTMESVTLVHSVQQDTGGWSLLSYCCTFCLLLQNKMYREYSKFGVSFVLNIWLKCVAEYVLINCYWSCGNLIVFITCTYVALKIILKKNVNLKSQITLSAQHLTLPLRPGKLTILWSFTCLAKLLQ